ncbi:MAG: adenosylcobinamide-phosphate synthase CbiB [Kiloniellaceae bacterium]
MLTAWLLGTGPAADPFQILLLALAIDAAIGDPEWLYRAVPHPVALVGRLVEAGQRRLNEPAAGRPARMARGLLLVCGIGLIAGAVGWALGALLGTIAGGWIVEAALASSLIAFRGLYDHVAAVARGLDSGLAQARAAVAHIVGRDPESLDAAGVARAAAESTAENFSDGVVAPVFWYVLFGLAGLSAYKAVNTLDSMIGHGSAHFEAFGKAAARLDDAANWLPARLSGLILVAAAALVPGARASRAWRVMRRDAPKHRSVNAGWPEAALAGALNFALAGPRRYGHGLVQDHWMGDGRAALAATDLRAALRLYLAANAILAILLVAAIPL